MKKNRVIFLLRRLKEISLIALADSDIIDEIDDAIKFISQPRQCPHIESTGHVCGLHCKIL